MTSETSERGAADERRWRMILLGCCAVAGVMVAIEPLAGLLAIAGVLAVAVGLAYGGTGVSVALAPPLSCFVLLNRFDALCSIPIGEFRLPPVYWIAAASVAFLLLQAAAGRRAGRPTLGAPFAHAFGHGLLLFAGLIAAGIVYNHIFGRFVPGRSIISEVISAGVSLIPLGFVAVLPALSLPPGLALRALRAVLALAAGTGLVMVVFALRPGVVTALLGWAQAGAGTLDLARGRTPLGHPISVGTVLLFCLPFCLMLGIADRGRFWRLFYFGGAASMALGILFSLSRSVLFAAAITVLACVAYALIAQRRGRLLVACASVAFLIGLAALSAALVSRYDFSRYWSRGYFEDASVEHRWQSMKTAVAVWRDHPVFGVSPGAIYPRQECAPHWQPDGGDHINPVIYYRGHPTAPSPHNAYLTALAEFGLLGSAALGWLCVLVCRRIRAGLRIASRGGIEWAVLSALGLALASLALLAMTASIGFTEMRPPLVIACVTGLALRFANSAAGESGAGDDAAPATASPR
ncbi:MAG: O-antigen ligase family protein [Candidatus Hydrogenedentes bacterium]|nr:O-antigen ligase family protein [Candidatus Hydrogenedentota bacterium]